MSSVKQKLMEKILRNKRGETVTIVGDHDPVLMKYFDCTRSSLRSAFDSNVVYQFEIMEYILDYAFDRMGVEGSQVDHPILITECACNPIQSCSKMAELLFETYGVPSVAFGVDAAFSYKYNQRLGICDKDGLAICSGFNTSHVIPVVAVHNGFFSCSYAISSLSISSHHYCLRQYHHHCFLTLGLISPRYDFGQEHLISCSFSGEDKARCLTCCIDQSPV